LFPVITYGFERVETFVVTVKGTKDMPPSGVVTIKLGSTTLCSTSRFTQLIPGTIIATCNLTDLQLPVDGYSVTAVYSGNSQYAGSTSGVRTFRVIKDRTSVNVWASTTNVNFRNESTAIFTATMRTGNGEPVPNGETVTVHVGTASCVGVLNGGSGTCTISNSALPPGKYLITTTYGGDANLNGDSSSFRTSFVVKRVSSHVARHLNRRSSNEVAKVNDFAALGIGSIKVRSISVENCGARSCPTNHVLNRPEPPVNG
jgi:archaellum component FlaF (FlaF/FlaG flagellin family)